jgi:hypothetical protein
MSVVSAGQVRDQLIDFAERLHRIADKKEHEYRQMAQRIANRPTYDWSDIPEFRLANKLHGEVEFLRSRAEQITSSLRHNCAVPQNTAVPASKYMM